MGLGNSKSEGPTGRSSLEPAPRSSRGFGAFGLFVLASISCQLDFGVGDRRFACPPDVAGCVWCDADGSCREEEVVAPAEPLPPAPPLMTPDEQKPPEPWPVPPE